MTHRLSPVIRGVEFEFLMPEGRSRKALVVASYLTRRYGCSAEHLNDLLPAFHLHRCELEMEAVSLADSAPVDGVLIIA